MLDEAKREKALAQAETKRKRVEKRREKAEKDRMIATRKQGKKPRK